MNEKAFHIGDILSITTSHLVSPSHIQGIYQILNYMTGDNLMTHQLPRARKECAPYILEQYPELKEVDASSVNEHNWKEWLDKQALKYGEHLIIKPLPEDAHEHINPIAEAYMHFGDKVHVIKIPKEDNNE